MHPPPEAGLNNDPSSTSNKHSPMNKGQASLENPSPVLQYNPLSLNNTPCSMPETSHRLAGLSDSHWTPPRLVNRKLCITRVGREEDGGPWRRPMPPVDTCLHGLGVL